jgi:molybdopterin-binding protein
MKLSARNSLAGTIRKITPGAVNAEVEIEVAPGVIITSIITMSSVQSLGLKSASRRGRSEAVGVTLSAVGAARSRDTD